MLELAMEVTFWEVRIEREGRLWDLGRVSSWEDGLFQNQSLCCYSL